MRRRRLCGILLGGSERDGDTSRHRASQIPQEEFRDLLEEALKRLFRTHHMVTATMTGLENRKLKLENNFNTLLKTDLNLVKPFYIYLHTHTHIV